MPAGHHGAGGHGVEQQADEKKNRTYKQKAFLWRIINAPACCAFSLTVLAALPVFFAVLAVFPARLAAYSFLMACFCCQRENGLLVSWGFPQRLLEQGVYIGLNCSFFPPVPLCGMASACGCGSLLEQAPTTPRSAVPRSCGRSPRPHCPFHGMDFLVEFPSTRFLCGAGSRTACGQLAEGGFSCSSSTSLVVTLPVLGSKVRSFAAPAFWG